MAELAVAAITEAVSENVDFEEGASLGENLHPQDGHIHNELLDEEMTDVSADDPSKREGDRLRRMARRMPLQHMHISPTTPNRFLIVLIDSPLQVLTGVFQHLRPCQLSNWRRSPRIYAWVEGLPRAVGPRCSRLRGHERAHLCRQSRIVRAVLAQQVIHQMDQADAAAGPGGGTGLRAGGDPLLQYITNRVAQHRRDCAACCRRI
jgi:hypothetical protein